MSTKKKSREDLQLLSSEALDAYMNREDFQYDPNGDALYRYYKDQYTQLGKTAMQDTMGQAAALTGGYGSSYAQNVGQQAYQSYLSKVDDVLPELYQLAYDRYRDQGERLYKTYQSWSQLEQQAAQQEQWEREYELEERKLKQQNQNNQTQTGTTQPDYHYHQNPGQHTQTQESAAEPEYDNGKVSEGNIKTMQRVLGLQETGKWTDQDRSAAGNLNADDAWKDYQQGKLQSRSKTGMSVDAWSELKKKQSNSSGAANSKQTTPAVQNFIAGTVSENQISEASYYSPRETSEYADTQKTKGDWEKELNMSKANLDYLQKLRSERDRLMQVQAMTPDTPGYVEMKKQWEAYYNQFDNLDERIDALEKEIWELERVVRYYDLSQNEDYPEKSVYYGGGSLLQEMVNNPSTVKDFEDALTTRASTDLTFGVFSMVYDALTFDNLHHMKTEERADFNYIHATEGEKAAIEYLEYLQYTLNERAMNEKMQWVSNATRAIPFVSQTVASVLSTPLALAGGAGLVDAAGQNIVNKITGNNKPIDYNRDAMAYSRAVSTIRGTVAQDITDATGVIELDEEKHPYLSRVLNGKGLADVYQFGMSIQDSAAIVGLAAINPALGKVGTVLLSSSAGTQTMLDAVDWGATDEQALQLGILSGAFELLFETYELDTLLNADDVMCRKLTNQALTELFGEGATEVSNMAADCLIMGKNSNYEQNIVRYLAENPTWNYEQAAKQAMIDSALQVAEAGFGGLISGGAMGGGVTVTQNVYNAIQAEVAESLKGKAIPSWKIDTLAEAIVGRVNDQELTRTQREILSFEQRRPSVQKVINDLIQKKARGVDSAQHNVYDETSTTGGNAVTEGAALHQDQNAPSEGSSGGGSKTISQLLKETTCSDNELYVYLSKRVGSDAAEAFAKNGTWPNEVQIPKNSSALNSDGSMNWSRAPQGGYTLDADGNAIKEAFTPKIGEVIDRYGAADGRYTSPVIADKAFSYSERSLPYAEDVSKYHRYEVTGDFTKIEEYVKNCENSELKAKIDAAVTAYYDGDYNKLVSYRGKVAGIDGWGKGGATQYEFSLSIEQLVELGLLKEIR